jgi:hypothetical protein
MQFVRLRLRWEDGIEMDLEWEGAELNGFRVCLALVTLTNLRVP